MVLTENRRKPNDWEIEGAKALRSASHYETLPRVRGFMMNTYFDIMDSGIDDKISDCIRRNLFKHKNRIPNADDIANNIFIATKGWATDKKQKTMLDIHIMICKEGQRYDLKNKKKLSLSNFENILDMVCEYYNVNKEDVLSRSRKKKLVTARNMVACVCQGKMTLKKIGRLLGGRDHSTIIFALKQMESLLKYDSTIKADYAMINSKFNL